MNVMKHINLRSSQIGVEKNNNCKFISLRMLALHIFFTFFAVKNVRLY